LKGKDQLYIGHLKILEQRITAI